MHVEAETEINATDSDDTIIMDSTPSNVTTTHEDKEVPVLKCSVKTTTYGIRCPKVKPKPKRKQFYKCNFCKERFPKLALLNKHYIDSHPPVKCEICDKTFKLPSSLERHSYLHKDLKFKCKVCGARFPFKSAMCHFVSHKMTHLKETPHECDIENCTKAFFNIGDLQKHKKVHLDEKWNCTICM